MANVNSFESTLPPSQPEGLNLTQQGHPLQSLATSNINNGTNATAATVQVGGLAQANVTVHLNATANQSIAQVEHIDEQNAKTDGMMALMQMLSNDQK